MGWKIISILVSPFVILSTVLFSDFGDEAWYFYTDSPNGLFHLPVSGLTHRYTLPNSTALEMSVYRFHDRDPLPFSAADGFRLMWRNGDTLDAAGRKCRVLEGGTPVGSPTTSRITIYAWMYVWNQTQA